MAKWGLCVRAFALVVMGGSADLFDLFPRLASATAWAQTDHASRTLRLAAGDIARATAGTDSATGTPRVDVRLARDAVTRLRDFTTAHVGKIVDIRVDGRVVSRPLIREPIAAGTFVLSGSFTVQEARTMANALGAGKGVIEFEVAD